MNDAAADDETGVLLRSIIGLSERRARWRVTRARRRFRVVRRDGVDQIITMDHRSDRVNVVVQDSVVTDGHVG